MKRLTVKEIIELTGLDAEIVGDENAVISAIAGMDGAGAGVLTFAKGRKNYKLLKDLDVSAAVVGMDAPADFAFTLIKTAKPDVAFVQIAQAVSEPVPHIAPGIAEKAVVAEGVTLGGDVRIGANAVVAENVQIGDNTIIYPGVFIGNGVKIGSNSIIYANVSIYYGCEIGDNVIIHSGAVIGADGFGFQWDGSRHLKIPQNGNVVIEDDVEIGANATVDRARFTATVIKSGCKIDNLVHIAHNSTIGEYSVFAAQSGVSGSVEIGRGVAVGGQVGFADHIKVGDGATFYAKSGVISDVEPGQIMAGQPAADYRMEYKKYKNLRGIDKLKDRIRELETKIEEIIRNETDNA